MKKLTFLSGYYSWCFITFRISALINQIVWIRKFGLVFGVDVYTMGTVLSAFMGGLALGSLIFGRLADKMREPAPPIHHPGTRNRTVCHLVSRLPLRTDSSHILPQ